MTRGTRPWHWIARLLAVLALDATSACAVDRPVSEPADSVVAIRALIGDAACDNDAQCRTVGIGARACGGPSAYLAWSSLRTDAQTIAAAAARQSEARRQELIARGAVSTCIALPDPGAYCAPAAPSASAPGVTHTCRLRPGGAGGPRSY